MSRVLPRAGASNRPHNRVQTAPVSGGLIVSRDLIDAFLEFLLDQGRTEETIYTYRGHLERMYNHLETDRTILPGTLERIGQEMVDEGYSPNTVNVCFAAVNSFLEYCGRRDLQVAKLEKVHEVQPEISRNEYLRLLSAARTLGKEREYLLIKTFATTGISVADLEKVTVSAVNEGGVIVAGREGKKERLFLSDGLKKEMLHYIEKKGILSGPVFLSRNGKPMERSNVNARISGLARDARVNGDKCNPRCLQRLYRTTMDGIAESMELLTRQMYMQLLDREQMDIGWEENSM